MGAKHEGLTTSIELAKNHQKALLNKKSNYSIKKLLINICKLFTLTL